MRNTGDNPISPSFPRPFLHAIPHPPLRGPPSPRGRVFLSAVVIPRIVPRRQTSNARPYGETSVALWRFIVLRFPSVDFLFVLTTPAQTGQPLALARVREYTAACHTCPSPQHHQTFLLLPKVTSVGSSSPFKEQCHSFASFGLRDCKSLNPTKTFFPVQ